MRIGYAYWGFLADIKLDDAGNEISAPDGNATYSWSILWEAIKRGHQVFKMHEDRDRPAWERYNNGIFKSFSQEKRSEAYTATNDTFGRQLPELDVLLLEWRFPIPGRNCIEDHTTGKYILPVDPKTRELLPGYQPDLLRQTELLEHYKTKNTKIIVWDLDHKLLRRDEELWNPDAVFETSITPLELKVKRTSVEPPFIISDLLQHTTLPSDPSRKMVYIGSRYERDDVIEEWIRPASERFPGEIEFHGNWLKTLGEVKKMWPNISYHDRCTVSDFHRIYSTAASCPLLAKRSYLETGFITPRVWEAILFGTVPIGLKSAKGIEKYVYLYAEDSYELSCFSELLSRKNFQSMRADIRRSNAEKLEFMDAKYFVDKIEAVL